MIMTVCTPCRDSWCPETLVFYVFFTHIGKHTLNASQLSLWLVVDAPKTPWTRQRHW